MPPALTVVALVARCWHACLIPSYHSKTLCPCLSTSQPDYRLAVDRPLVDRARTELLLALLWLLLLASVTVAFASRVRLSFLLCYTTALLCCWHNILIAPAHGCKQAASCQGSGLQRCAWRACCGRPAEDPPAALACAVQCSCSMQLERVHQDVFSSITGCSTRVADLQCSVPSTQVAGAGELLVAACEDTLV